MCICLPEYLRHIIVLSSLSKRFITSMCNICSLSLIFVDASLLPFVYLIALLEEGPVLMYNQLSTSLNDDVFTTDLAKYF